MPSAKRRLTKYCRGASECRRRELPVDWGSVHRTAKALPQHLAPLPPLRPSSWNAVTQLASRRRDVETALAVSCDEREAVSKMDTGMLAARPMNTSIRLKISAADTPDMKYI